MLIEHQLLSKVLDEKNFFILNKYNITEEDFVAIRPVYQFVKNYVMENKGEVPDYRTVVANFEEFEYIPEVADTFQYLCKTLKHYTAKRLQYELFQKKLPEKFTQLNGEELNDWIMGELQKIAVKTSTNSQTGTNFATNGLERLKWFEESKINRSNIFIPTPYPTLTESLAGGFELGDYILLNAFTNRGKSWLASHMGLSAWRAGFGVLHYSPELSKKQQLNRLDTLMGHFNNVGLRNGELAEEEKYKEYLMQFTPENYSTPYIVKTMEDLPNGLSVEVIENDILANPEIKMVIIDGFNLMNHKGKDSNRNNMSNTSRQLRQLFGKYGVVGLVVHQTPQSAEKENMKKDEIGNRIVKPPEIHQYSETIAVIQDACTVLTFDQVDGLGKLKIVKARQPVVGKEIDLNCNFNYGFIEEVPENFNF